MFKKKLKKAISIFQWFVTVVLILVVLLLIFTVFSPIKSFQVLRVMSGSMEPKIKVGSVVFVQKIDSKILEKGDVITYTSLEDPNISITHRLTAIEEKEGETVFKTQGDANNSEDIAEVSPSQVKGKVIFSLPFLGYLSVWIRKPLGFGLLVILPAILIIISEIFNIKKTIEKEVEKKYKKRLKEKKISKKKIGLLIFWLLGISFFQIKPTNAYFSDTIVSSGNTFSMADNWTTEGDTTSLKTTLTIDKGLVVDEKVENGDFKLGGSIADWDEFGSTERLASDFEVVPYEGNWMAKVGDTEYPGYGFYDNSLQQCINPETKNLSFYYNFYTYDNGFDASAFSFIINEQTVWDIYDSDIDYYQSYMWKPFYDSGYYDDKAFTYATGWQKTYVDLTQFGNNPLDTVFYAGNTDDNELQSWVYLDEVTTTEVVASASAEFYLTSDPSDATRQYYVQNGEYTEGDESSLQGDDWDNLIEDFFTLSEYNSGDYTVYYRSIKDGFEESPNIVKVHLDKEKPEKITDLETYGISASSVMLSWTVPPDLLGTDETRSASYNVRYWLKGEIEDDDEFPCDISDWDTAQKVVNPPMPRFPYELQDLEVIELDTNVAYCFGIKTCDAALNCSDISTVFEDVLDDEGNDTGEDVEIIVSGATLIRDEIPEKGNGDVVINEIMWMGSSASSNDEWVELRNMTDHEIDLTEWQIVKKKSDGTEECMYTFHGITLQANDYIVVSEYNDDYSALAISCPGSKCLVVGAGDKNDKEPSLSTFSLYNTKLQLKLYDGFWTHEGVNLIDTADDWKGVPATGEYDKDNNVYWSMERNSNPGDGTNPENWHTCKADAISLVSYWDTAGLVEKGTPGALNLSELIVSPSPSIEPSPSPSLEPSPESSSNPSSSPSLEPSSSPRSEPTSSPTPSPSLEPSPSPSPSSEPSSSP